MAEVGHPQFGLMLGSLHVAAAGLPLDAIDTLDVAKVFLVQLCDWPTTRLAAFKVARHYRLFPGEGVGLLRKFVERLERIGYTGCYSVEVINDHYLYGNPLAVAQRAVSATLGLIDGRGEA